MKSSSAKLPRLIICVAFAAAVLTGCGANKPEQMVSAAKEQIAKKDNKAAIIHLRNALQKAPDNAEARYLLGRALLETGDAITAEKELRKALDLGFSREETVPLLAKALVEIGQSQKVIDDYGQVRLATPQASADLDATIGYAQLALRKPEEARTAFESALIQVPDHPAALLGQARLKGFTNDLPGARALVDRVLQKFPLHIDAMFLKSELLTIAGDSAGANKLYDEIIKAYPNNVRAHFSRIVLSLGSRDIDNATTQMAALNAIAPNAVQTQYLKAALAILRKDYASAREASQQVLKSAPNYLPALLLAGEVEYLLNSFPQAQRHLQKVLEAAPRDIAARRLLTAAYLQDSQPSRALETITPLLNEKTVDASLYVLAGEVYLGNNDLVRAEKYFSLAAAEKNDASTHIRLGQVLLRGGNVIGGMEQLETAASLDTSVYQADVLLIAAHMRQKNAQKALAAVAALEKKQPNNPLTHYLRAGALLMSGDAAASRKSLERSVELDGTYFPAVLSLAKIDVQEKKLDSAQRRFDKILEKDGKNPQALLALAQLRTANNAPASEVTELLNKAVAGNPTNIECRQALILNYMSRGDRAKAVAAAQEAQAAIPNNAVILDALGVAQQANGETNQAVATFVKLAALRPKAPEPLFRLASAEAADKRKDAAVQTLRKALALKPDYLEAQLAMIGILSKDGRTKEAVAIAKEIQRQRPKVPGGYLAEGDIYAEAKNWTQAAAVYRSGLDKVPDSYVAVKYHSAIVAGGRTKEATVFASEWIKNHAKDVIFRSYVAEVNLRAKNYELAATQYKELIGIAPKDPAILNNLAWVAGELNDPKAVEYAEEANKLQPNSPAILDTLGVLLTKKGDATRSVELLRQATALAPAAWTIRINLAKALSKAGQREAAKKELEPMLKLDANNPVRTSAEALQKSL